MFTIGIYETLIFIGPEISENFSPATHLPVSIVDEGLIINDSNEGIIGIIAHDIWSQKSKNFFDKEAKVFTDTYVKRIVEATHLKFEEAKALLQSEVLLIDENLKPNEYASFFNKVMDDIIKKNTKT